jgi:hypothetical protein
MALNGYNLTTAWDLSTMNTTVASTCDLLSSAINYSNYYNAFFISPDGTRLYYSSNNISSQATYYWTLSTPWDLSTKGSLSIFYPSSSSVLGSGSVAISPTTIQFSTDGSRYFIFGGNAIQQFTCTTPWDLSTATVLDNSNFINRQFTWDTRNQKRIDWYLFDSTFGGSTQMLSCTFNNTGTALYVTTDSGSLNSRHSVYKIDLENPWDITSLNRLSYSKFLYENQITNDVHAIRFKSDGTKMYLLDGGNQDVYQYSISTTENVIKFDLSTGVFFKHSPTTDVRYKFINPQDDTYIETVQLEVTNAGTTTGYDLANAAYDSKTVNLSTTAQDQSGIFFKPDGTVFYALSFKNNDTVYQYSVSTAWDISTVNTTATNSYDVSAQDSQSKGLFFKPDGTKMYVVGATTNYRVYEYDLSTAWDLSTVSYNSNFYTTSMTNAPIDLYFKPDGTKMYTTEANYVYEYDLSTAWDVTTASFVNKSSAFSTLGGATNAQGFFLKDDGTELYQAAGSTGVIYVYALTTAWDTSTIQTSTLNFSAASQTTAPGALFFGDSGTKMYTNEINGGAVYQYSTGSTSASTITWDDSIIWSSYSAPTMPAINETDTFTFQTKNGGVSYVGLASGDDHS